MSELATSIAVTVNWALPVGGLILGWRLRRTIAALNQPSTQRLPAWELSVSDFLLFFLMVTLGGIGGGLLVSLVIKLFPMEKDPQLVLATLLSQVGILAGVGIFRLVFDRNRNVVPAPRTSQVFLSGVVTFVVAMPLILFFMVISQVILTYFNVPMENQQSVRLFMDAKTPFMIGGMILTACVGAPWMEELVFRAGIFRYVRTRVPRFVALVVPALFFAMLHVNWLTLEGLASFLPLVALAIVFSLAYEHTGQIGTVIVAHALFNFYTVLLIFCGVGVS